MKQPVELVCNICSANRSKSGRLFDPSSLAKHMTMVHPAEGTSAASSGVLICDICGVNQNYRGKKFTLLSHLLLHKKKQHPEALNSSPSTLSLSTTSPQPEPSGRRKRAATHTPANHASLVKFCPHCGFNLAVVHAAIEFVNGAS